MDQNFSIEVKHCRLWQWSLVGSRLTPTLREPDSRSGTMSGASMDRRFHYDDDDDDDDDGCDLPAQLIFSWWWERLTNLNKLKWNEVGVSRESKSSVARLMFFWLADLNLYNVLSEKKLIFNCNLTHFLGTNWAWNMHMTLTWEWKEHIKF